MVGKYFSVILFVVLISSLQCNSQTYELDSIGMSYSKKLLKRVNKNKKEELLNDAASILNNHINLNLNWPAFKYDGKIDWNVNPYNNTSWLNYFYSLRMLAVLGETYQFTLDESLFIKGKELLISWDENYQNKELLKSKKKYIMNDHAVANRVINLLHFSNILEKHGKLDLKTKRIILKHLLESGDWLFDDRNYTGGNHAIMMDRALLYLGYSLVDFKDSSRWIDKAKSRFKLIMDTEVTEEGVSVENSPQYHSFIMDLLKDFIEVITSFGEKPPNEYLELFEKMKSYLVYVLQPNLIYPFQGDTYPVSVPLNYSKKYNDSRLEFVDSYGKNGDEPENIDVVYPEAGYAILREKWGEPTKFKESTYLNFIGGVPSKIHKHSDNLSFSLFSNQENIFIDPGSWGYAKNDTVIYLASTKAHNTFTINDQNISDFPINSSKIIKSKLEDSYSLIEAEFTPNPFEKYSRKIIFIKPNLVLLDDYVISKQGINTVEQIFNLGLTVEKIRVKDNALQADFKNSSVQIIQLKDNDYEIMNYTGADGTRGLYSLRTEQTVKGNQFIFKTKSDSLLSEFNNRTLISISSNKKSSVEDVEIKESSNNYSVNWTDSDGKSHSLRVDTPVYKDVFNENIQKSVHYNIAASDIDEDFGIDSFYVLKWMEGEYSFLFRLSENTTTEGLRKKTIGLRAFAKREDLKLLSSYSKKTNRNYDGWNIKENEIIETNQGNFIYLNISTNLKSTEKFKIFLFDRSGYVKELWNHTIDNFYFDNLIKELDLKRSIEKASVIATNLSLSKFLTFDKLIIDRINKESFNIYIKLPKPNTDIDFSKYKLGLHTYVNDLNLDKLTKYSKLKKRSYDAWDFTPKITEIDGIQYIIKKINTPINEFPKIELFLYDSNGYKGIIGNKVELKNIIIE